MDAIDRGDSQELKGELGDLLLQVVFHARIAAEQGDFAIGDIIASLNEKLIHRHPHVFSDTHLPDAEAVLRQRLQIKAREKQGNAASVFAGRAAAGDAGTGSRPEDYGESLSFRF